MKNAFYQIRVKKGSELGKLLLRFGFLSSFLFQAYSACYSTEKVTKLVHPGTILNSDEINLMKKRVSQRETIWINAADKVFNLANLSYTPMALPYLYIGGNCVCYHNDNGVWAIKKGCFHQDNAIESDGEHSIAFAYAYILSGKEVYAVKAIEIMKAWNKNCLTIYREGSNNPLELGWMMSGMVRAAELLKYTYPGWAASGAEEELLSFWERCRPIVESAIKSAENGSNWGQWAGNRPSGMTGSWWAGNNWRGTIMEAQMMIAILKDDPTEFNNLCDKYKTWMIDFGISSDDFLSTDTRRDSEHGQMHLAGLLQCAEIAFHQGIDLFGLSNNKILKCMEANAKYGLANNWTFNPVWEIGYNHYKNRKKMELPYSEQFINKFLSEARPDHINTHWGWQFLTHYSTTEDAGMNGF